MKRCGTFLSTSLFLTLCACVGSPDTAPQVKKSWSEQLQDSLSASVSNVPPGLMGDANALSQAHQMTASTQEEMLNKVDSGAEFFTDAHNPDAIIPGLDEAFAEQKQNSKWIQSYSTALREAARTGKPILIWFHHSKSSPPSIKLATELLHSPDFETWARDNIVRVCYDQAEEFENERIDKTRKQKRNYVQKAPSVFGVRGTPVLLIMSPDGNRVDTLRGYYNGQRRLYFDQIKNSARIAVKQYEEFKKGLITKGYRTWTGANGNTLFAKLSRYTDKDGAVWLQEADGHQTKTSIKLLSAQDKEWILSRKAFAEANARKRP